MSVQITSQDPDCRIISLCFTRITIDKYSICLISMRFCWTILPDKIKFWSSFFEFISFKEKSKITTLNILAYTKQERGKTSLASSLAILIFGVVYGGWRCLCLVQDFFVCFPFGVWFCAGFVCGLFFIQWNGWFAKHLCFSLEALFSLDKVPFWK